jgi:D-3-phosphoglycerate dehydrogenase
MVKVLISDKLDPLAVEVFEKNGIEIDYKTGLSPEELLKIIGDYDGLAVRSSTVASAELIAAGKKLKVIGRAGIGVDNIDVPAATNAGVVVMNTPFGNSITTAEHALSMMMALARQIPQANESTHAGKWEKNRFMGVELYNKVLGVIGCGNIGSIVADRALGLKMKVIAFDPFLTEERATEMGVEKVELDTLFSRADFITIHVPKNEHTSGLINTANIAKMKDGVRIINCARGGIVVERDLLIALESGKVGGAALDVFEVEPAKDNLLFGRDDVICTPHLGASTSEAQVNVAIQVAEQMSDYLKSGAVTNALNMPSISAEDAPRLKPYIALAEALGRFAGQTVEGAIDSITVEYHGSVTDLNTDPVTSVLIANLLAVQMDSVNMVNAKQVADSRGIRISESFTGSSADWRSLVYVYIHTDKGTHSVKGTLFTGKEPRIVEINGVPIEAALTTNMLFIRNEDKPGLIGAVGTLLGGAGHNIADFRLGRDESGQAVCLVSLDQPLPDDLFGQVANLPQIRTAMRLHF